MAKYDLTAKRRHNEILNSVNDEMLEKTLIILKHDPHGLTIHTLAKFFLINSST